MNKEQLLATVKEMAQAKTLKREEVISAYDEGAGKEGGLAGLKKNLTIARLLYIIGGVIVLMGIIVLIVQNWDNLNSLARIIVTFGVGLGLYVSGVLLNRHPTTNILSKVFFVLSGILLPIGLAVAFNEIGIDVSEFFSQIMISGILFVMFLVSILLFRSNLFVVYSVIYGTWLYYSIAAYFVDKNPALNEFDVFAYLTMALGIAYVTLGYSFNSQNESGRSHLTGPLYSFGLIGFLSAALALSDIWDLLYLPIIVGVIFLSVYLKSKAFLWLGTLFLMAYIIKITGEYFTDSLGWPLALVIAGLALIGAGYVAHYLNKKYITVHEGVQS